MMPRYKQPKKLENLAISKLGDWVANQAKLQIAPISELAQRNTVDAQLTLTHNVDSIRYYLEYNVPWMLHDSFATEAIRALSDLLEITKRSLGFRGSMGKFVSQMNVIIRMTEVLFTKNLTYVCIETLPKMIRSVFYSKLNMLTGLVYLNLGSLSGGWKTADMEDSIIQALKELHELKYLFINYDCTDNILKCLADNCKKIEKLDVSSSKCVTDESINLINKLKNLRSIQLYRSFVTVEGFANLLINSKKLEDVGRCDEIGRVLEHIKLIAPEVKQLKLKTYVSRYASSTHMQLAVEMCPEIRSFTAYHNTLQSDLMVLIGLSHLCELKLLSCDFYADSVKQVLQVKGCHIVNLHLEHVDQIDLNALMYMSQMCPLLKALTLYNCTLIQHTSLYTRKLEILPFRNLKRFSCMATCTDEQLYFILSNALNLEFLHIGTAVNLSDEFVCKLLNNNPLIYLKELRVMQSDFLTMRSVQAIIQSCISLEILVELECWALLTDTDRAYVRNYININNFNVDIGPTRR